MFNQMRIQYVDFTEQQRSPPPNYRIQSFYEMLNSIFDDNEFAVGTINIAL